MVLDSADCTLRSVGSAAALPYLLVPFSPGLRRDRARAGMVDILGVFVWFVDVDVVVALARFYPQVCQGSQLTAPQFQRRRVDNIILTTDTPL